MDSGARRLVVDVTDESDDGIVVYAFLRCEFAFVGIADEVLGIDMLYPSGLFVVCRVHCLREFIQLRTAKHIKFDIGKMSKF